MSPTPSLRHLDWLMLLLLSWVYPIVLVQLTEDYRYFWSLAFWTVPILLLGWRALQVATPDPASGLPYSRRRRGLYWTVAYILGAGIFLDFVLGPWVLQFALDRPRHYVYVFERWGIPVEEVFFYALAPLAILFVYIWCDEYWMPAYSQRALRLRISPGQALVGVLPGAAAAGVLVLGAGILYRRPCTDGGWPVYFIFLTLAAFVPSAALYKTMRNYVNWQALGATTLYAVGTSILWEATLAVPQKWWGYQPKHMLGIVIPDWSRDPAWPFPVEAAAVWVAAPLTCVLVYEFAKAREYRRRASS